MVYIIFSLFVIYVGFNEYRFYNYKKEDKRKDVLYEKRFNEFENYAYTDIRDLLDFLDEVKKHDKK